MSDDPDESADGMGGNQMKIRSSLLSFFLGVAATAIVAAFALYGRDLRWQQEAFEHHAGCYYWHQNDEKIYWAWADDYHTKVTPKHKAPPAPKRSLERL
jgi:hypothetical protein